MVDVRDLSSPQNRTLLTIAVSGLSAAHTVYLNGGNVLVLDKQGKIIHSPGLKTMR